MTSRAADLARVPPDLASEERRALTAAERMGRTRAHRRAGLRRVVLLVDESLLEDALLRRGLLAPRKVDDRSAFAAAALVALHEWAEAQLTPPAVPDDQDVARNYLVY